MSIHAYIVKDSPVRLWGLSSSQRLKRVLRNADVTKMVDDLALVPQNDSVLLLKGDYLFDERVIGFLVDTPDTLLKVTANPNDTMVAAHVPAGLALQARNALDGDSTAASLPGVRTETLETLSVSFLQRLRKFDPPFVLPVSSQNRHDLERRLFEWSYKGVTDLVTKWAWPRPARWAVGECVRFGLRPNHVTIMSLLLVILTGILFAYGFYGWGLLAGWLMTFLDTVDGKLARVTVTSSRFGHYFDHIIDIVHPPIWYILWGLGLEVYNPAVSNLSINAIFWLLMAGYVAGRLVEAVFTSGLGRFGIFCWRPLDSYFRLITARRNPCMLLLTVSALFGRPDLGLVAVAFWTVLTSFFLVVRLVMAAYVRVRKEPLRSWLLDADQELYKGSLAVQLFTRRIA